MTTLDTVDTTPVSNLIPAEMIPTVAEEKTPTMFKTQKGFNIDITGLAKAARADIESVQTIHVPSQVKRHKRLGNECETPTLSEVGGGVGHDFCQVIAETDARPISIDNVLYVNSDPAKTSINHGTVSVAMGTHFSIGWKMRSDSVILIYEIIDIQEYVQAHRHEPIGDEGTPAHRGDPRDAKQIARLTCELAGHALATWKSTERAIPGHLRALYEATEQRLKNDVDVPFYIDVFRMVKADEDGKAFAENMANGVYDTYAQTPESFAGKVFEEILDIRRAQFNALADGAPRKVDKLRAVEKLTLNHTDHTIDLELTLIRKDPVFPIRLTLQITADNFIGPNGRMIVERGLALNCNTFERLWAELASRKQFPVVVNLTSLR